VVTGGYLRKYPYPLENIIADFHGESFVTKNTKIIVMGSCFAQEIEKWLKENAYNCQQHVWGCCVYTTKYSSNYAIFF